MYDFNAMASELIKDTVNQAAQNRIKALVDFLESTDDLLDGNYSGFYSEVKTRNSKNTWIISVEKKD